MAQTSNETWADWKAACTIEKCVRLESVSELSAFATSRLKASLCKISQGIADLYCDSKSSDPRNAWLQVEKHLHASPQKGTNQGKAYKDVFFSSTDKVENIEKILSSVIRHDITRSILQDEGFDVHQVRNPKTGHRNYRYDRLESIDDEKIHAMATFSDPLIEYEFFDEKEAQGIARQMAEKLWSGIKTESEKFLVASFLREIEVKEILASKVVDIKKSQVYNVREKFLRQVRTCDWGNWCTDPYHRILMTRLLLPEMIQLSNDWILTVENPVVCNFILSGGQSSHE